MKGFLRSHIAPIILTVGVCLYILYFSLFGILRYESLGSHYFDLGIMHQAVYNSYMAIKTSDYHRFLEITDPHESTGQVKRMAVHNDVILGVLAFLYFVKASPSTLIVFQTVVIAFGAYFVFSIGEVLFRGWKHGEYVSLLFAFAYLLYPPIQRANNYDFHGVTLSTTLLLGMYYFWMKKKLVPSTIFAILSVFTKEQLGFTVALFGIYSIIQPQWKHHKFESHPKRQYCQKLLHIFMHKSALFGYVMIGIGLGWSAASFTLLIPMFRTDVHFAASYVSYILTNPFDAVTQLFSTQTIAYMYQLLVPFAFFSLLAPIVLLISLPELILNILSNNDNLRNIYYHYTSVITPFVVISAMYGFRNIGDHRLGLIQSFARSIAEKFEFPEININQKWRKRFTRFYSHPIRIWSFVLVLAVCVGSVTMSPLPWSLQKESWPSGYTSPKRREVAVWQTQLADDSLAISTTGHLAPLFSGRRRFLDLAGGYADARYVVVDTTDVTSGYQSDEKTTQYETLRRDFRYMKISDKEGIEVYVKLRN